MFETKFNGVYLNNDSASKYVTNYINIKSNFYVKGSITKLYI